MMKLVRPAAVMIALGSLFFPASSKAIMVGQLDDFQDNTLQNWHNGETPGVPPVLNISTGGPAGAGDHFMQITADGSGAGRFLTVFNRTQWLGDYIAARLIAIELDLRNQGNGNLNIRLAFKDSTSMGSNGYLTAPFSLAVGSGWRHAVFLINPGSLFAVGAPASFNTFFSSGVAEMRIINEAGTTNLNGDNVVGQLGIDNIHAVPEPSAFFLAGVGLLAVLALRRKLIITPPKTLDGQPQG